MEDKRDVQMLKQLFADYQGRFTRFARTYIKDEAVAEDFFIEALMQYWENRESLRSNTNIPAYILTIIKNKCLNHLQHQHIHQEAADKIIKHAQWEMQTKITSLQACNPEHIFSEEAQAIVDKTLMTLPERTRSIFLLSRYEDKTHKEIATLYDITIKGVEFHISKALKILKVNLKDYLSIFLFLC